MSESVNPCLQAATKTKNVAKQAAQPKRGVNLVTENHLRKYETVFIVRPTLDDEAVDRCVNTIEEYLKNQGGKIISTDKKGRKRLSYEVKKLRDGFFVVLRYEAKPESIVPFKRILQLNEDVIRSITVVLEEAALQVNV